MKSNRDMLAAWMLLDTDQDRAPWQIRIDRAPQAHLPWRSSWSSTDMPPYRLGDVSHEVRARSFIAFKDQLGQTLSPTPVCMSGRKPSNINDLRADCLV